MVLVFEVLPETGVTERLVPVKENNFIRQHIFL